MPTPRVLVVSAEPVGARMAGPAIRAYELARTLGEHAAVTLAAPRPSALPAEVASPDAGPRAASPDAGPRAASPEAGLRTASSADAGLPRAGAGLRLLEAGLADYDALISAVREHDVVVAQLLPPRLLGRIWQQPTRLVVDLYNPTVVEVIEATRSKPAASRARLNRIVGRAAAAHLAAADFAICASERQRDLWLGVLAGREALEPDALDRLAVVPFGVRAEPPRASADPVMRGVVVPEDARVLLWGGGIWDWLDAPTAIRAVTRLPDDVVLVFQGVKRPALLERDEHAAGAAAIALARELGLEGTRVVFNHDWVPYEERGAWLLEADVGVSAHPAHLETRFASRTRIADYLWAGLPVVTSAGDVLGDHVEAAGLGRAVPPGDDAAFAAACAALLADPEPYRANARAAAEALRWDRVVEPLEDFCLTGTKRRHTRHRARQIRNATIGQYAPIAMETLSTDGAVAVGRKLAANARRALRRV